jgi:hypothetical protein
MFPFGVLNRARHAIPVILNNMNSAMPVLPSLHACKHPNVISEMIRGLVSERKGLSIEETYSFHSTTKIKDGSAGLCKLVGAINVFRLLEHLLVLMIDGISDTPRDNGQRVSTLAAQVNTLAAASLLPISDSHRKGGAYMSPILLRHYSV